MYCQHEFQAAHSRKATKAITWGLTLEAGVGSECVDNGLFKLLLV